ncbi:MAG TPA: hypothetical protein VKY85_12230 [Candidatus Angelobacter sp.]|nr:hypothetical protein [Candidatus Angelobacter sp.]
MRTSFLPLVFVSLLTVSIAGCGGGGAGNSGNPGSPSGPTGTTVTVTLSPFTELPSAAGVQTGTGPFKAVAAGTLQSGQVSFTLPNGSSNYAFAYVCQAGGTSAQDLNEFVIEATTQDATSLMVNCVGTVTFGSAPAPTLGSATGKVDGAGTFGNLVNIVIAGKQGFSTEIGATGSFNASLPAGTNDIAVVAVGGQAAFSGALGVKIFRNQTVPGIVNGGNTITFGSDDATLGRVQQLNVNAPAGFTAIGPQTIVEYTTANGTTFTLENSSAEEYPAVPDAAVQSGDFYSYGSVAQSPVLGPVGLFEATANGGGLFNLNLPDAWSSTNPTTIGPPAVFTFDYPGFSGIPVIAQSVGVTWEPTGSPLLVNSMTVTATANFQNGANTITIPDLSSAGQGFVVCCPSGVRVGWSASILGATMPLNFLPNQFSSTITAGAALPGGVSVAFVESGGSFTAP